MTEVNAVVCPGCGMKVDEAFYPQHIESGHKEHVIIIKGLDPMVIAGSRPGHQTPKMLDLPYIGRVRRDAWVAYSLLLLLLGVLMGARII